MNSMPGLRYSQFLRIGLTYAALMFASIGCQVHPRALEPLPDLPPATRPDQPPFSVSRMRVQTVHPSNYYYIPVRSSFQDLPPTTRPTLAPFHQSHPLPTPPPAP